MKIVFSKIRYFLIVLFALGITLVSPAQQWTTNGPYGGWITTIARNNFGVFAGTMNNGLFVSTNNGATWSSAGLQGYNVSALVATGANLVAAADGDLFLSGNNGATWTSIRSGLLLNHSVRTVAVNGSNLFAGTSGGGVFISTDNGNLWTAINSGLSNLAIHSIEISGPAIFAGTAEGGLFVSNNNGASWSALNANLPTSAWVTTIAVSGSSIFVGSTGCCGVYRSTDGGVSWSQSTFFGPFSVSKILVTAEIIFAGGGNGVYQSTNNGDSWTPVNSGLTNSRVTSLALNGTTLFAGTQASGIFISNNNGSSWVSNNLGLTNQRVLALETSGSNLFAATDGGVFVSANNGTSWTVANNGLTDSFGNLIVSDLAASGSNLFAAAPSGVFISSNQGASWTAANTGLPEFGATALAVSGSNLFAGFWGSGVFLSTNNGGTWTAVNSGLTSNAVYDILATGTNVLVSTGAGIFVTANNGASWARLNSGWTDQTIGPLAVSGSSIFAGAFTFGGGIFRSNDNGVSWTPVNTGLTAKYVNSLLASGGRLFAGTPEGVFVSDDNGNSWRAVGIGLPKKQIFDLSISGTNLFAGTESGVYLLQLPAITNFSPTSGGAGTSVTISGTNFSTTAANNTVTFNGVAAVVTVATATSLTVTVPATASGPIAVTVNGVSATSGTNFTILDFSPPVINDNSATTLDFAIAASTLVSAVVTDNESAVTSVVLQWRSISAGGTLIEVPLQRSGSTYSTTLSFSSTNLPDLGIEYRITAVSTGGTATTGAQLKTVRAQSPAAGLTIPYASFGSGINSYRIVSVPLVLGNASLGNVFEELGTPNRENWRLLRYENGVTSDLSTTSIPISPGLGYWLIVRTNRGPLQTGPGTSVQTSADAPFEIDLRAGWNQIGNPYNFNLSWADVQSANPGLPGLRGYNGDFVDATQLDRMGGGFVRVSAAQKLRFPVVRNSAVNGGRSVSMLQPNENPLTAQNWLVKFSLTNPEHTNTISGFGMAADASQSFDPLDGLNMPTFFDSYLELRHHKQEGPDSYSMDIVATKDHHVWSFEVVASHDREPVRLSWDNRFFGENEKQLFLWDVQLQRAINMRAVNRYLIHPQQSGNFKVVFGSEALVKKETSVAEPVLHPVWPNPAQDQARVAFTLPDSGHTHEVEIQIIDAAGRICYRQTGQFRSGYHEVEVSRSALFAPGVYIVQLQIGGTRKQTRLVWR